MNPERVKVSLSQIGKIYRRILDDSSDIVLPVAIASVDVSRQAYLRAKRSRREKTWGYTISAQSPLRFRQSAVLKSIEPQVDIYCNIQWADDDVPIIQDIKVRMWSRHYDTIFNPVRDADAIGLMLDDPNRGYYRGWRVISRIHFDRASHSEGRKGSSYHPEYHLQFGGKPEDIELCWHPKSVDIPRLIHQPMDLVLVCQLIARTFFPEEYQDIKRKFEWQVEVIQYQDLLLRGYYEKCRSILQSKESLLDNLESS